MYKAHFKLKNAGITVYSVKIDAFTIKAEDEQNAREVLDFDNKIGRWRVSKYVDIKLPNELYQVVENQIVEIRTYKNW